MKYNKDNAFYKIIHKELKSNILLEGEHYIVIHDIRPKAPVHVLIITKGEYTDWYDFVTQANPSEIVDLNRAIAKTIDLLGLKEGGYKIISNSGKFGMQEVPHMHVHVLGNASENE
ncbi:MAG: HIT domain-containing protein [Holosporales bacterium]|jgi:histidine triad (HIT) family protein|nr:HIT domain-containing protein [Holosporales bacterium]